MACIFIVIDGMTDEPIAKLKHQTPFEYAECTAINSMITLGGYGEFLTCPPNLPVDSLTCILTLLGVKVEQPMGRAYFEAVAHQLSLKDTDLVMRGNLVAVNENGELCSSCGGNLSGDSMKKAVGEVGSALDGVGFRFYPLGGYKNLLILENSAQFAYKINDFPPHQHIGKPFRELLPREMQIAKKLDLFYQSSSDALKGFADQNMSYQMIPWGASCKQQIPDFYAMHQLTGAAVCATEIVRGIAICMGMTVPEIPGATADTDTNLKAKASVALELAQKVDIVFVHINGADEAAHRKNPIEKANFLKRIDRELVAPLLSSTQPGTSILLCPDHATLSQTGKHQGGPQPFFYFNSKQHPKGYLGRLKGSEAISLLKKIIKL